MLNTFVNKFDWFRLEQPFASQICGAHSAWSSQISQADAKSFYGIDYGLATGNCLWGSARKARRSVGSALQGKVRRFFRHAVSKICFPPSLRTDFPPLAIPMSSMGTLSTEARRGSRCCCCYCPYIWHFPMLFSWIVEITRIALWMPDMVSHAKSSESILCVCRWVYQCTVPTYS